MWKIFHMVYLTLAVWVDRSTLLGVNGGNVPDAVDLLVGAHYRFSANRLGSTVYSGC